MTTLSDNDFLFTVNTPPPVFRNGVIDVGLISDHLDTAGIPDPDLIIRTAGEMRLSNFLLWQAAYAEYWCTDVYWPDFDGDRFKQALSEYGHRERRFGGLSAQGRVNGA